MTTLPSFLMADKTVRVMGCLPPKPNFGGFRRFAASNPIIPRSDWRDVDLSPLAGDVWDQGNHGSCVGHGSTKAFEIAYRMAGGTVPPSGFSPTSLYALINGNQDQGAIVSDAMDALIQQGVCTMSECPESVIYTSQIPASANATRKRFRVADAYHTDTFDAIGSALMLGFPVSVGTTIYSGWNNPGPDGLIPIGGYPLGGHCYAIVGIRSIGGVPYLLGMNSWGVNFANKGFMLLPEWHMTRDGQLDAFAIRADISDPQDANPVPVAA